MVQFKAKAIDLDLELTLLNGEEIKLSPKIPINTKNIITIIKNWRTLENNQRASVKASEKAAEQKG